MCPHVFPLPTPTPNPTAQQHGLGSMFGFANLYQPMAFPVFTQVVPLPGCQAFPLHLEIPTPSLSFKLQLRCLSGCPSSLLPQALPGPDNAHKELNHSCLVTMSLVPVSFVGGCHALLVFLSTPSSYWPCYSDMALSNYLLSE